MVAVLLFEGVVGHPEVADLLTREAVALPGDELFDPATALDVGDSLPDSLD